jgi:sialic acid synthase SpsE
MTELLNQLIERSGQLPEGCHQVVAARYLSSGRRLALSDIASHRPGDGYLPKRAEELVGALLTAPVTKGTLFARHQVKPPPRHG